MDARHAGRRHARLIAVVLAALTACSPAGGPKPTASPTAARDVVVVASFNFPESELLAEIYARALEHAGVPVRRELDLGPREQVQPALRQGLVDVVPEYLGTALASVTSASGIAWGDPSAVLAQLRRVVAPWDLEPLQPAPAEDQNGVAVTQATATALRVRTLSDLAAVRPPLILGGPSECPKRPYCLPGLRRVYGLQIKRFVAIDDEAQRAAALTEGVIDAAVTFTTDGRLATGRLVLLRDDRRLQPTERIVPIVSTLALRRYGARITDTLNAVSAALTSAGLRFLNWRIVVAGKAIPAEANGWLRRHGLLSGG